MNCVIVGDCSAGYYCTGGAWIPDPVDNVTGNICPQHHVCKAGSDTPKTCSIGYHANSTGMSDCQLCMAGFLCSPGSEPALCPLGEYPRQWQDHIANKEQILKILFLK